MIDNGHRRRVAYNAITCIRPLGHHNRRLVKITKRRTKRVRRRGMRARWILQGGLAARIRVPQRCVNGAGLLTVAMTFGS